MSCVDELQHLAERGIAEAYHNLWGNRQQTCAEPLKYDAFRSEGRSSEPLAETLYSTTLVCHDGLPL